MSVNLEEYQQDFEICLLSPLVSEKTQALLRLNKKYRLITRDDIFYTNTYL